MNKIYIGATLLVILLLLFAPCTVNGVTHYRGLRGCSSDDKNVLDRTQDDWKHGSLFGGLIKW